MPEEVRMIHVRLPGEMVRQVDILGAAWEVDRAKAVERLLQAALPAYMPSLKERVMEVASAI